MPALPPDTRAVGTGNPAADMDAVVDVLQMLTGVVPGGTVPAGASGAWNSGFWDPRAFGAVGDGVTDDTAACQAAIAATPAAGGIVNFGGAPVSYAISAPLTAKAGCTFVGSYVNAQAPSSHLDISTLASFSGVAVIGDVGALSTGPVNTVGAGSNGGTLSGIAAWATPSAGVLATGTAVVVGAGGFPTTGQLSVVTAGGTGLVNYTGISGSSFTGCTYASGTGTTVATGGTITGASPSSSYPITMFGVSIDLTNCPGSTTDGFRLMTYGGWVHFCMTKNAPQYGMHFTDQNAGGFNIVNSGVENRVTNSAFVRNGVTGIRVDNFTASLTDGYCTDNIISQRNIHVSGNATDSTGPGIDIEYAGDWQISRNHVYACPLDAIVIRNAFGTFISSNDVDTYGLAGAASTIYHGLYVPTTIAGPATIIESNIVRTNESFGAASTTYQYYNVGAAASSVVEVGMRNNCAHQTNSGSGTSTAWTYAGGTGTLNVIESGGFVVGSTISAVNTVGSTNLLVPGGTCLASGSVSVPVGLSSVYGTITNLLTPLITGTAMTVLGVAVVWAGAFSSDVVNVTFTMTWDDGTTSTAAAGTQSSAATQNLSSPVVTGWYKQGRQLVKLQAQARTTQASTSVTCNCFAVGVAVA